MHAGMEERRARDQFDCEHKRRCKLEGRSHLTGLPMNRR